MGVEVFLSNISSVLLGLHLNCIKRTKTKTKKTIKKKAQSAHFLTEWPFLLSCINFSDLNSLYFSFIFLYSLRIGRLTKIQGTNILFAQYVGFEALHTRFPSLLSFLKWSIKRRFSVRGLYCTIGLWCFPSAATVKFFS